MRMNLSSLPIALSLALAGCGSVVADPESPEGVAQAVEASYGGETPTDEQPAFGDPTMTAPAFQTEDRAVADMTTDRPELRDARHVRVAVLWGYPRPRPEATEAVNWSGNFSVTNAGLRVINTIKFEQDDVVIRPRTDIHVVEFESQTKPHADGLLLDVVIAPVLNPDKGPIVLTMNTAPFTGSLTIEPGMRLSRVVPVDDAGHVVAYHVIRPDGDGCAEGFFRGRWQTVSDLGGGKLGVLKGRFAASDGRLRGHLRGVFGVREDGKQVWFAKVIDREGKLIGLVAGRWADGKLGGLFLAKNDAGEKIVKGMLRGVYFEAPATTSTDAATAATTGGGFFGRYSEKCGEDPREGMATPTDEPEVSLEE